MQQVSISVLCLLALVAVVYGGKSFCPSYIPHGGPFKPCNFDRNCGPDEKCCWRRCLRKFQCPRDNFACFVGCRRDQTCLANPHVSFRNIACCNGCCRNLERSGFCPTKFFSCRRHARRCSWDSQCSNSEKCCRSCCTKLEVCPNIRRFCTQSRRCNRHGARCFALLSGRKPFFGTCCRGCCLAI